MTTIWSVLLVVCIAHPIVGAVDKKDWISFLPEDAKVPDFAMPVKRQQKSVADSVSSASSNTPQFSQQFPSQPFSVVVVPNMEGVDSFEVVDMLRKGLNITDHSTEDASRESREFFFPNIQRSGSNRIIGNQLNHDSIETDDNSNEIRQFQQTFQLQPEGNSFFVFNPNIDKSKSIDASSSHNVFEQTVGIGNVQSSGHSYSFPVPESYKLNKYDSDESDEKAQAGLRSNQRQPDLPAFNVPFQTQYEKYSSRRVNEAQRHENKNGNILLHRQASSFLRGSDESLEVLPNIQIIQKPKIIQKQPSFIQAIPGKSFVNGDLLNSKSQESPETHSEEDFPTHNPESFRGLKEEGSSEFRQALPKLVHPLFGNEESKEDDNSSDQFEHHFRQNRLPDSDENRSSNETFQQLQRGFNSPEDLKDNSDEQFHGRHFGSHESNEFKKQNSQERGDTVCIDGQCFIKPDSHESEEFGKSLIQPNVHLESSQAGPNLFVVNHSPCFGEDCNQFQSQKTTHTPPLPVFHQISIEDDNDSSEEECDPTTIVSTSTTEVLDLKVSTIYSTVPQVVTVPTIVTSSMVYTETHTSIVEASTRSTSYVYDTSTVDITSQIVEPKTINVVTTEYPIEEVTHTHRHRYTEIVPVTITTTRTDITRTNPVDYAVLRPVTETKTTYTTSNLLTTEVVTQYVTVTIMSPIPVFQTDSTVMTQTNVVTVTHDLYENKQHIENSITVTVNPSPVTITQYKTSTTTHTKTIKSQVCSQNPYRYYGTPKFNHNSVGNAFFGNNLKSFDESTWPKDVKQKTSWQAVRHRDSERPSNYKIYSVEPQASAKLSFQRKREAGQSQHGDATSNPELVSLVYAYGYGYPNFLERVEAVP